VCHGYERQDIRTEVAVIEYHYLGKKRQRGDLIEVYKILTYQTAYGILHTGMVAILEREREFIFQVRQTKYYSELMNRAEGYQNR